MSDLRLVVEADIREDREPEVEPEWQRIPNTPSPSTIAEAIRIARDNSGLRPRIVVVLMEYEDIEELENS